MSYLLVDDQFAESAKVQPLHDRAFRFHVAGLCYCARHLTDGHLSGRAVKVIAATLEVTSKARTAELVVAGLWKPDTDADGFWIHDYLKHNPSAAEVKVRKSAAKANAKKRWATNGSADSNADGIADSSADGHALPSPPMPLALANKPSLATRGREPTGSGATPEDTLALIAAKTGDAVKVGRAARGCAHGDLIHALEACQGPGVRDPLAVALAELKKRRAA